MNQEGTDVRVEEASCAEKDCSTGTSFRKFDSTSSADEIFAYLKIYQFERTETGVLKFSRIYITNCSCPLVLRL